MAIPIPASGGFLANLENVLQAQLAGGQLENLTAAVAGAPGQQWSPGLKFTGQQHNGGASVPVDWMVQARPMNGNTDPGNLLFLGRYNSGAWVSMLEMFTGAFGTGAIRGGAVAGTSIEFNTALILTASGQTIIPPSGGTQSLGTAANFWVNVYSNFFSTIVGGVIMAANTITPTAGLHHITGATVVKTIAVGNIPGNARLTLVADSAGVNWDATGNIGVASLAPMAQFSAQDFQYDVVAALWYPVGLA